MTTVAKTFTFDAAHRLQRHDGKCQRLHGHTYRVKVSLTGDVQPLAYGEEGTAANPQAGMVVDFGEIVEQWKGIAEDLDHRTILEHNDPLLDCIPAGHTFTLAYPPTAENLAAYIWSRLAIRQLQKRVTVWETPTSSASYPR